MKKMTIAQGLRRKNQLEGQMKELAARAASVVSYAVTKKPAFDFAATRGELNCAREELVTLSAAIARANATTTVDVGGKQMSIAEGVRRQQEAKGEISWLRTLPLREGTEIQRESDYDEATGRPVTRRVEVTYICGLSEVNRVAEVKRLEDCLVELNDALNAANHVALLDWQAPVA